MSDDLDDRLRAAMKVLDDEVPSGYFDALASRTLARLEDHEEMQTMSQQDSGSNRINMDASSGVPPEGDGRDEDSGLHDIRSLASSTKLRISKRVTTIPPVDEDILASSSAGWKAVALPEPAKMVSLPELTTLPAASEVKAKDKASRKVEKAAPAPVAAKVAEAAPVEAVAAPSASAPVIGARFAKKPAASSKTGLYAAVGIALAAAAGVGVYLKATSNSEPAATVATSTAPVTPTATPIEPAPAPAPEPAAAAAPAPAPAAIVAPADPAPAVVASAETDAVGGAGASEEKRTRRAKKDEADKPRSEVVIADSKPAAPAKPAAKAGAPAAGGTAGDSAEPSFDALLKEAGVQNEDKDKGPKLDKKSLSSADIRTAMGGVASKAQGCYSGTQGTASVKLTVAPSGKVSKVKVTGPFAGTPTAACVESAVRDAEFPPWDGGPQSVSYSYLLAE